MLYEQLYCARGEMENRIKECQLDLFADRTSTKAMRSNQLRLWFASMAYVLVEALRRIALPATRLAQATAGTIRLKLLKIGALVRVSVRRVTVGDGFGTSLATRLGHRPRRPCRSGTLTAQTGHSRHARCHAAHRRRRSMLANAPSRARPTTTLDTPNGALRPPEKLPVRNPG